MAKMCLRKLDQSTVMMSDDERFPPLTDSSKEDLGKGFVKTDSSTVVKDTKSAKKKAAKKKATKKAASKK